MQTPVADYFDYPQPEPLEPGLRGMPVEEIRLFGVRERRVLDMLGCRTLEDLCRYSELNVLQVRGCGISTWNNIKLAMSLAGYEFSQEGVDLPLNLLLSRYQTAI